MAATTEQAARFNGDWRAMGVVAAVAALSVTALLTVLGFLNSVNYIGDLAAQFRVQYVIAQILCLLLFVSLKRWRLAIVSTALVAVNAAVIAPLFVGAATNTDGLLGTPRLRIVQANINWRNDDPRDLIRYVREKSPDLLLVVELSPAFLTSLCKELPDYQFRIAWPDKGASGIGLFSRLPMSGLALEPLGGVPRPNVFGRLRFQKRDVTFIGTHLHVALDKRRWLQQKNQLAAIGGTARRPGESVIVAGDFNSTTWTSQFQQFMQDLNLIDTRVGLGTQPTWPSESPITRIPFVGFRRVPLGFLNRIVMLPIDHFLVSRDFVTLKREVGPDIGSDHYPVYLELGFAR